MEHVDELIPGHALRALDAEDERIVVTHLAECDRCRRQLAEFESVASTLAYAAPAAEPPPELRGRIMDAIEPVVEPPPEPAEPRRFGWWPWFAAVTVPVLAAAVIGLAVWNVSLRGDIDDTRSQIAAGTVVGVSDVGNAVASSDGSVTLYADLPAAPAGKTYEAWVISGDDAPMRAGEFEGGGSEQVRLTQQVRPGDVIAVTVEPDGGSDQPTSDPIGVSQAI